MSSEKRLNDYDTVSLSESGKHLVIIDQTLLPGELRYLKLRELEDIREAIYMLRVRGAPAIGVAAAIGLYVIADGLLEEGFSETPEFLEELRVRADYLADARPTAVNLRWAVDRMMEAAQSMAEEAPETITEELRKEALKIRDEDVDVCRRIGEHGLTVLRDGQGILTHCNAGRLATVRYGTATAPIYIGQENGYEFRVFADETRPLLQGARLTSYELAEAGIDVTLICDNMAATVLKNGWADTVITGADRVAANGDSANKIGTMGLAIIAKHFGIPFYIAAPTSTIDMDTADGSDIIIEERPGDEIRTMWYERPMAPEEAGTYNPSFDVTDHELITGIITEYGIAYPPFRESLAEIMRRKECEE
ncbi:MAG: S-methyl-5-thioribose-1-phosphate isomerase [Firmicutes bacterium]|nr:S-methyl-5-thioribose-1-phosphate isomerase [Bacillota bacterium]